MRKYLALVLFASVSVPAFACLDRSSGLAVLDRIQIAPKQAQFILSSDGTKLIARLSGTYALAHFAYSRQCSAWWSGPSDRDLKANHEAAVTALASQPFESWSRVDTSRAFVGHKITLAKDDGFQSDRQTTSSTPTDLLETCVRAQQTALATGKTLTILRAGRAVGLPTCEVSP